MFHQFAIPSYYWRMQNLILFLDVTTAALYDRNARSSKRQCSSFWHKFIYAFVFCFGLLYFTIRLYMARHILYISSNITNHVNQQTYGWNRVGQDLSLERTSSSEVRTGKTIDADILFGYRDVDITHRTEPLSNLDIFASNRPPIWTRLKREIARDSKDCDLNDQHCMQLLQSMESYLEKISKVLPNQFTDNDESVFKDILMCLKCKKSQQSTTTIEAGKGSARPPSDHYQTHNYVVVQNHMSDSLEPDIELLDDDKAKDGSRYQGAYSAGDNRVNRTEITRIQESSTTSDVSQDAVPNIPSTNTADTTVVSIDRTNSNGTARDTTGIDLNDGPTTSVNDVRSSNEPVANNSRIVKGPSDGRIPASSADVDEGRVIAQGNVAKSSVATLPSPTTEMSTETSRYNTNTMSINDTMPKMIATTAYPASPSETNTPSTTGRVDFTRQITVAEYTTNEPTRRIDVIGIDDDDDGAGHAAARPSHEGHPENQSSAAAKVTEGSSTPVYWPFVYNVKINQLHTNTDGKAAEDLGQTSESAQGFQEIQLNPTMSWTMPHPVCFYGPPGQPANRQSASETTFYPGLSGSQRESPTHGSSSQPNYVQVQVTPSLNYTGNPAQAQTPTGPGVGSTGPGVSNFSPSQQPAGTSSRVPYFCTYISMPIVRFPSIPDVTQLDQSAPTEMKQSAPAMTKPGWYANWLYKSASTGACPPNSRPCASDGYCVPKVKWCDGRVDCTTDASDETMCSCRDRISRDRLCDGYFDCPHGEDELGCFDCPEDSFSCDDWEQRRSSENCVPLEQRCDGVKHCRNGKDELDCSILSPSYIDRKDVFTIGYTQGYLHKNVRGQWYPVCAGEPSWSVDACASETGQPLTAMPEIRIVQLAKDGSFQGPYVNGSDGKIQFASSCSDTAVFVKCPPFVCGTIYARQDSSPVFNLKDIDYAYKKRAEEKEEEEEEEEEGLIDSEPAKFAELYWRTLELLDGNRSKSEERDGNDDDDFVRLQSRVVGGRASWPMAWPSLVAIYIDGYFHCGGVILNEIRVLTAAHCMDGYRMHYFEVRAGMLRQRSFSPTAQSRRVKKVTLHENYDRLKMRNDIALITLDEPLLFNRWVRQVCLPEANHWEKTPNSRSKCIAIGWGAMRENGPDPDHLREVQVPILPLCKHLYDQNDATVCAGYPQGGRDACQGDSGGPLMCRASWYKDAQWYVAGVISHGDGCGRRNEPGVYTKVSHFVQWIRETSENSVASSDNDAPLASCPGFSCRTGLGKCLPIDKTCDRIVDCLDAEDEVDCFGKPGYRQYWQLDGSNKFVKSMHHETSMDRVSNDTADNQMNETVFIFVPYKTQETADKDDRSNATNGDATASSVRLTFTCTRLIQTITINKRCDRHVDCQDGTDEDDCTCRDFLANLKPAAICDGHPDCDDRTDEKSCGMCKEDEFLCGRSGTCILIERRCDGKFDCPLREDEIDCFALTDGDHVSVDSDNRPLLNAEGLLNKYVNGTWRTECISTELHDEVIVQLGENTCQYLGFASSRSVDKVVVNKTELTTGLQEDWRDAAAGACTALRIRCGPVLSGSADSHLIVDPRTGSHDYLWPWLAAIFVDGRYRCSALLLEPDWLLSNARCTRDIRLSVNYTTALLGRSRSYLYVDGPHQQISIVDQIKNVKQSNASLLHLKTAVNLTYQVLPLFAGRKIYPPKKSDMCVAIGTDEAHVTRSIFVQPILDNCDKCRRCFIETADTSCSISGLTSSWSGTVFCHSRKGWYPAAVFQENDGPCSFRNVRNLTSIDYIQAYLTQALEDNVRPIAKPTTCDGVRCSVGQCVPWNRVCDGVLDCRDGADERIDRCSGTQSFNNVDRKCTKSELRCGNGECVPKRMFCDDKVDCSDGTDEPVMCTCAEYLKVTAPERLCDGVRHCVDKSDELPEVCHCTENSFKCDTKNENSTCLPQDFVCDGDEDCPNGEDEKLCVKVKEFTADRPGEGEVIQRSYGVWHSRCFPAPVTSQEEARTTCAKLGYANGTIDERAHPTADEPTVPSRDDFYMVRVNVDTWIIMRDDKQLVSLVGPEEPCHRLFVKCTS